MESGGGGRTNGCKEMERKRHTSKAPKQIFGFTPVDEAVRAWLWGDEGRRGGCRWGQGGRVERGEGGAWVYFRDVNGGGGYVDERGRGRGRKGRRKRGVGGSVNKAGR